MEKVLALQRPYNFSSMSKESLRVKNFVTSQFNFHYGVAAFPVLINVRILSVEIQWTAFKSKTMFPLSILIYTFLPGRLVGPQYQNPLAQLRGICAITLRFKLHNGTYFLAQKSIITTPSFRQTHSVFARSELPKRYLVAICCMTTNGFVFKV